MEKKWIPIVGKGCSKTFFGVDLSDDDLMLRPMLGVNGSHHAIMAFELSDEGLSHWNLHRGDFLLFDNQSFESVRDKIILVRMEDQIIIRQARYISPDQSILTTPGDIFPTIKIPSENMRIIGVMTGFIKPYDQLSIRTGMELA